MSFLSVKTWLCSSPKDLRRLGHDPNERVLHCGHTHRLLPPWPETVGMWSRFKAKQIMEAAHIPEARRVTYAAFRANHHLHSVDSFTRIDERRRSAWALPWLCYGAMSDAAKIFGVRPDGELAYLMLNHDSDKMPAARSLGVLPVELMLWARALRYFLNNTGLTYAEWKTEELDSEREKIWGEYGYTDLNDLLAEPSNLR